MLAASAHPAISSSVAASPGRRFTSPGRDPLEDVEWTRRDAVIRDHPGREVFRQDAVEVPASWSQTATDVVASKYFRGALGSPQREGSVRQLVRRVVGTIAGWGRPTATSKRPPKRPHSPPSSPGSSSTRRPRSTRRSGSTAQSNPASGRQKRSRLSEARLHAVSFSRIERGNPEIGVERQHRSAAPQPSSTSERISVAVGCGGNPRVATSPSATHSSSHFAIAGPSLSGVAARRTFKPARTSSGTSSLSFFFWRAASILISMTSSSGSSIRGLHTAIFPESQLPQGAAVGLGK